jgi:hypothetical protein
MKHLFLLVCLFAAVTIAKAQTGTSAIFPLVAGDTLNNTDTVFKKLPVTAGYNIIGINVDLTKISGTVAGKAILYGSTDGVTYFPTDSMSYVIPLTSSVSTPTVTNMAYFQKTGAPWTSYLITATSSGTVSAQVRVRYVMRYTSTARAM